MALNEAVMVGKSVCPHLCACSYCISLLNVHMCVLFPFSLSLSFPASLITVALAAWLWVMDAKLSGKFVAVCFTGVLHSNQ